MADLLIKNGRVIDPANNVDRKADLLIAGETVEKIGTIDCDCGHMTVIDAAGNQPFYGGTDAYYYSRSYFSTQRIDDGWRWPDRTQPTETPGDTWNQ